MEIEILKVGELETNCYLIIKDGKCLIIDPGADENYIVERIKNLNVEPVAILITHYHPDHIGAKDRLKEIYNIEEYGYENLFEERVTIFPFTFNVIYIFFVIYPTFDFLVLNSTQQQMLHCHFFLIHQWLHRISFLEVSAHFHLYH